METPASAHWEAAGSTDVGKKRALNEDVFLLRPDLGLFIVCDGMGGHSAGEVAAGVAAQSIADFVEGCRRDPEGTWPFKPGKEFDDRCGQLEVALRFANRRIREAAELDSKKRNMGTTTVTALLTERDAHVAWAGDSRGYLYRQGAITQVTDDHSLMGEMLRSGKLRPEEAEAFPYKNVITKALGPNEVVRPDVRRVDVQPGDVLLLCCDGVHGLMRDADMAAILSATPDLHEAAQKVVALANDNGGTDNITVVLVRRRVPGAAGKPGDPATDATLDTLRPKPPATASDATLQTLRPEPTDLASDPTLETLRPAVPEQPVAPIALPLTAVVPLTGNVAAAPLPLTAEVIQLPGAAAVAPAPIPLPGDATAPSQSPQSETTLRSLEPLPEPTAPAADPTKPNS